MTSTLARTTKIQFRAGLSGYIAELGSCQIGMTLGLPCDIDNHASYVGHWLDRLKADKTVIFKAAAAAQRAVDYCLAFHPDFSAAELDAGSAEPLAA